MPPRPGLFLGPGCAKQLRRARIVDEQWIMTKTTTTFHVSWLAEKTPHLMMLMVNYYVSEYHTYKIEYGVYIKGIMAQGQGWK